jgi:hypothetical protein
MGLGKKDLARLKEALAALPEELKFLEGGILDVAKQDEDLIGSGEGEMTVLDEAMRGQIASRPLGDFASKTGNALSEWLEEQDDPKGVWAGPIWGVQGYLLGMVLFGAEEIPEPPKLPKLKPGFRKIEVDIPQGMKSKSDAGALELRSGEVQIFVMEMPEEMYRMKVDAYSRPLPANFPSPPHLKDEREMNFRLGNVSGIKATHRHMQSGLPVMREYILKMGDVKVHVMMIATSQRGVDLDAYESIIASIRPRGK